MGYVIVGGAGLLLGVGLMIWALKERAARHAAERAADAAEKYRREAVEIADQNRERAVELERQVGKVDLQLAALRGRLNEARQRLVTCRDPKAIKDWLDSELDETEL